MSFPYRFPYRGAKLNAITKIRNRLSVLISDRQTCVGRLCPVRVFASFYSSRVNSAYKHVPEVPNLTLDDRLGTIVWLAHVIAISVFGNRCPARRVPSVQRSFEDPIFSTRACCVVYSSDECLECCPTYLQWRNTEMSLEWSPRVERSAWFSLNQGR